MINVGKIVSTHGIKGELRIISDFEYKNKVFVVGNTLYIKNNPYKIRTYRKHKNFDMVTLNDYNDINQVLDLLKSAVYFKESDLKLDDEEVLDSDLMKYTVVDNKGNTGYVMEVFFASPKNKILRVMLDKEYLISFGSPILKKIDKLNKKIIVDIIDGM